MGLFRLHELDQRQKDPFWVEHYEAAVLRVAASSFCNGAGDRGWKADFDWILGAETVPRVMEGKYDNRKGGGKSGSQPDHSKGF